jgi:plasmid maintenance system antidote protein VapI
MAHRLGRFFGDGPGVWLRLQQKVDTWDMLHMDTGPYERIDPVDSDHELIAA